MVARDQLLRLPVTYDNAIKDPRTKVHGYRINRPVIDPHAGHGHRGVQQVQLCFESGLRISGQNLKYPCDEHAEFGHVVAQEFLGRFNGHFSSLGD
jgi:hypothetical protein